MKSYRAGFRVSEMVSSKKSDIDSKRMEYLFENKDCMPYNTYSTQLVLTQGRQKANIIKEGSIHFIRHIYATSLC